MGCASSSAAAAEEDRATFDGVAGGPNKPTKQYMRPKWKTQEPMTASQLKVRAHLRNVSPQDELLDLPSRRGVRGDLSARPASTLPRFSWGLQHS